MPSSDSILQASLDQALTELVNRLQLLVDGIIAIPYYPLYVQDIPSGQAREHLCQHIVQLEYDNDQMKGGETISYQGICGAPEQVLQQAADINNLKTELSKLLIAMDKQQTINASGHRVRLSTHALQLLGYARFNRRQAVRRFNVFDNPLDTVSFFWARQRKVKKATVQQVHDDLVNKLDNAAPDYAYYLKADLAHLSDVPQDETLFYVYQKNDHPRANYKLNTPQGSKRGSCMASSVFFYLAQENAALPRIRDLPPLENRSPRLSRNDKTIDDTPFLPSIHIHRQATR